MKRILIDGGYVEGGVYYFYLTDHLGNNRVVANATGTPIQKNHYYPFGTPFAETSKDEQGKQPYKYNDKEYQQMHQLNLYDYSARQMDGIRFTSVDPLAEKYYSISPYAYVMNNPLRFIDPNGTDTLYFDHKGNLDVDKTKTGGNDVIFVTDSKGNIHSRSYKAGTFKEYGEKHFNNKENNPKYAYISANSGENSKDIFEFMANNTTVEWGIQHT